MTTVRIVYHHEPDGWWAESPDVAGWSAAGEGYTEVVALAARGRVLRPRRQRRARASRAHCAGKA